MVGYLLRADGPLREPVLSNLTVVVRELLAILEEGDNCRRDKHTALF